MNKHLKGSLFIIVSMFFYSVAGPFVRLIGIKPEKVLFLGYSFGALFLLVYFIFTKKLNKLAVKKERVLLFFVGVLAILTTYTFYKAYILTTLSNTVLVHYLAPIIAAVLAPIFLKEKLEKITMLSLIVSLAGLYLITFPNLALSNEHFKGIFFSFLSAIFYGLWIIANKRIVEKISFDVILFYQALIAALIAMLLTGFDLSITLKSVSLLAPYALLVYVLPGFLYLSGIKSVKAQHAGIIAYAEAIFVTIFGFLFFKEIPGINTIAGGLLIVFSGYLIIKAEAKRK